MLCTNQTKALQNTKQWFTNKFISTPLNINNLSNYIHPRYSLDRSRLHGGCWRQPTLHTYTYTHTHTHVRHWTQPLTRSHITLYILIYARLNVTEIAIYLQIHQHFQSSTAALTRVQFDAVLSIFAATWCAKMFKGSTRIQLSKSIYFGSWLLQVLKLKD